MKWSVLCLSVAIALVCQCVYAEDEEGEIQLKVVDRDIECPDDHVGPEPCKKKMCEVCVPEEGAKTCTDSIHTQQYDLNYEGTLNKNCIICGRQGKPVCNCALRPKVDDKCPGQSEGSGNNHHNNNN